MKKIVCYSAVVMLLQIVAPGKTASQVSSSTYFFIKPIYAFSANSTKLQENSATTQGITYTKATYGSYGRGPALQIGIGKMISNTFGFDLAGEWIPGKKLKGEAKDEDEAAGVFYDKVNAFLVKPMLVLRNSGDLLSVYSKLGFAISVYSRRHSDANVMVTINNQPYQVIYSAVDKIKAKVGFTAAFGLSFRVSQAIAITGEVNGQMISLPPKNGHYKTYTVNGIDQLSALSVHNKSWTYVRSVSTAAADETKPEPRLYSPANFSYIGASVGIRFFL